jgi:hypothetical protein
MMDVDFGDEEVRDFPHLAKPSAWAGRQAGALRGGRGPVGDRLDQLHHWPGVGEAVRVVAISVSKASCSGLSASRATTPLCSVFLVAL